MKIINKEGKLLSRAKCVKGCGLGKTLEAVDTQGELTQDVMARLIYKASDHEARHPTHQTEVTFYELPVERITRIEVDMRARREEYVKSKLSS